MKNTKIIQVQWSSFDEHCGVLQCDRTLHCVFDISSQLKLKLTSKQGNEIEKLYAT